jgi:GNAT superfamily N-acetyltransferase
MNPKPPAPRLRPATAADAAAVTQVLLQSRRTFLPFLPQVHSDDDVLRWVGSVLLPAGGVSVAEDQGHVVAMAAHAVDNGIGWIEQLYCAKGHTAQGLGRALLHAALAELHAAGADCVRLWCFQANTGGRRFYEREGFVAVDFTDGRGNEEGMPDVLYERRAGVG